MSNKARKAKTWEEIDENVKGKLLELRKREIELKQQSGYTKWLNYFIKGSLSYSALYYFFYFRKQNYSFTPKTLSVLFIPICLYGFTLMKLFYDKEKFKEYYMNHLELNRLIKKTSQSSEYK